MRPAGPPDGRAAICVGLLWLMVYLMVWLPVPPSLMAKGWHSTPGKGLQYLALSSPEAKVKGPVLEVTRTSQIPPSAVVMRKALSPAKAYVLPGLSTKGSTMRIPAADETVISLA